VRVLCVRQFVVYFLEKPEPLHKTIIQLMLRLFLVDDTCNFFFMNYGGCKRDEELGVAAESEYARVPGGGASGYFVMNMSHFGRLSGYDLLIKRLAQEVRCRL
jgi:hypothetical protein